MSDVPGPTDGDAVDRPRLPGESQRPVMPPRERRVSPQRIAVGGVALVVLGAVGLSILTATGMALPATSAVLIVLIPVGIGVAMRGLALQRRASQRPRGDARGDAGSAGGR